MKIKNIFKPTAAEEYALAKRIGDKRFGGHCVHDRVKNSVCQRCGRKVIA